MKREAPKLCSCCAYQDTFTTRRSHASDGEWRGPDASLGSWGTFLGQFISLYKEFARVPSFSEPSISKYEYDTTAGMLEYSQLDKSQAPIPQLNSVSYHPRGSGHLAPNLIINSLRLAGDQNISIHIVLPHISMFSPQDLVGGARSNGGFGSFC